jgi:hypothetical protein
MNIYIKWFVTKTINFESFKLVLCVMGFDIQIKQMYVYVFYSRSCKCKCINLEVWVQM